MWGGEAGGDLVSWKKVASLAQRGDADPISHYVALGGRGAGTVGSTRGAGAGGGTTAAVIAVNGAQEAQ